PSSNVSVPEPLMPPACIHLPAADLLLFLRLRHPRRRTLFPYTTLFRSLIAAIALGLRFIDWAWALYRDSRKHAAIRTFKFSLWYLLWLFVALLVDHYAGVAGWL